MGEARDGNPRRNKHLLLTGRPGCGKTTVLQKAIAGRERIGGFYTSEVRDGGKRTGFSINALDGRRGTLASRYIESRVTVGPYGVNVEDLDRVGTSSIESAIEDPLVDVILIDEIAAMEISSRRFQDAVLAALGSKKNVLGTIQSRKHPFLDDIRNRDDVEVMEVNRSNREKLVDVVGDWIEGIRS